MWRAVHGCDSDMLFKVASIPEENHPDATGPTHSEDGVDLTLIRWMLSLTPAERLRALQSFVNAVLKVRAENVRP